jgi:AbrB family looped-hinge helix DNA binding protein
MKAPMSIVRVKTKRQVTLPAAIADQVGLNVGDLLEAKIERGKITLTPKSLIDQRIAESLEDYKAGRSYGPFETADDLIASLRRNIKKRSAKKTKRA